jgi:GTP 3',8-cyclase
MATLDTFGRPLRNLRLSVTDRCNLRCAYCMPEEEYAWLPRGDLLSFEELAQLVEAFCDVGVNRVRLTGGEPLLRRGVEQLVALLAANRRLGDVALTTNGVLLADKAAALRAAGLHRITVSLDTLLPERFRALTRRDELGRVLAGIDAASAAGFEGIKLDTVVLRGRNDDELCPLLEFARARGAELRFIEYMDVGGATTWTLADVVPRAEMLARIGAHYGPPRPLPEQDSAPADRYVLPDGLVFGVISSTTQPFCGSCDRSRVTADGMWYTCLYARSGRDLRAPLRAGASREELARLLGGGWLTRVDRGAEERLASLDRSALADAAELRANPHLEMHKRGG